MESMESRDYEPLTEMPDREILIEIAEHMRYTAAVFASIQSSLAERGIGGLLKDMLYSK